ncbi:MAG: hypothetical protein DCF22_08835 [Leptolyngbya sp.]|nr:MAG: hypothetical protein DCF22_08835 [Leptolyngbya sp.]
MNLKQLIQFSFLGGAIALIGCNTAAKEPSASSTPTPTATSVKVIAASNLGMSTEEKTVLDKLLKDSKKVGFCGDSFNLEAAKRGSKVYKLENQQYFVMLQCFLAAYQGNYEFLVVNQQSAAKKPVTKLTVTEFAKNEAGKVQKMESPSIGGFPTYDPKQRVLTVNSKYRGLGDCGSKAKYQVQSTGLKLLEFKAKFACDGKLEPFQTVYTAK